MNYDAKHQPRDNTRYLVDRAGKKLRLFPTSSVGMRVGREYKSRVNSGARNFELMS